MSAREVKSDGPLTAPIAIIGEAPGYWENLDGKPFVGPSGNKLSVWLRHVGLRRRDCWIDNVYRFQPPSNKLHLAPRAEVEASAANLHERLAQLTGVKIIVPMGNYALRAVLRKPLWAPDSPKISDWRGSVLTYELGRTKVVNKRHEDYDVYIGRPGPFGNPFRIGRDGTRAEVIEKYRKWLMRQPELIARAQTELAGKRLGCWCAPEACHGDVLAEVAPGHTRSVTVIPTLHPATVLYRASLTKLCLADWAKIAQELRQPAGGSPRRHHIIAPSRRQVRDFERRVQEAWEQDPKGACLAVDIETNPKLGELICVGFSLWPDESLVLLWSKWPKAIRRLCESPIAKALQNGHYDTFWLRRKAGIELVNWQWDTLAMHHSIAPQLPHDLATQATLYTSEPFWKKSPKDEDTIKAMKTPLRALLRYNGIDCCVTRELVDVYRCHMRAAE